MVNTPPTTEERVWAVLSHLSAIAFGMGIVLPVIGWSEQRRKSNYASYQCLQALGYQSLGYTVWLLTYLLLVLVFITVLVFTSSFMAASGKNVDAFMGIWMGILFVVVFGTLGIYLLLPVIAAIACALGKDFRYPIMGMRLAKYLGYDSAQTDADQVWLHDDHADRWVAAMGHFSIIITLWGMLAPLTAWILQGKRSLFLKFQSIQTLVYQAGVMVLFLAAGFIYMVGFAIFGAVVGFGVKANSAPPIAALVVFIIFMLIAFVIILVVPLFHIMGQWAGYRILKGDDYRYPVAGNLVEKQIAKFDAQEKSK